MAKTNDEMLQALFRQFQKMKETGFRLQKAEEEPIGREQEIVGMKAEVEELRTVFDLAKAEVVRRGIDPMAWLAEQVPADTLDIVK